MRFTLVYDGPLPAQTSHDGRVRAKHVIREAFHRQLAELWNERPQLRAYRDYWHSPEIWKADPRVQEIVKRAKETGTVGRFPESTDHAFMQVETAKRGIFIPFQRGAFTFVPLATRRWDLVCELDILFLRAEPPGTLFPNGAGDLDNRLKVLFDALRVPAGNELPQSAEPTAAQDPFFCLMEDDKLITAVRLESERLLDEPEGTNRVKLVARVTVKARRVNMITMDIEGD